MRNCKNCNWCVKLIDEYICIRNMKKMKHPFFKGGRRCNCYSKFKKSDKFEYPTPLFEYPTSSKGEKK